MAEPRSSASPETKGKGESSASARVAQQRHFKIVKVRYFELLDDKVVEALFPDGFVGWALEHAAVMTTSLHLHLTPELVDMSLAPTHGPIDYPPYYIFPQDPARGTESGCLSSPAPATAEKGKLVYDTVVGSLRELMAREFAH